MSLLLRANQDFGVIIKIQVKCMRLSLLNESHISEIIKMESDSDTSVFIIPYNYEKHLEEMHNPLNLYLGIYEKGILLGFFILGVENKGNRIEFRRIVIKQKGSGYGQKAIRELEEYCAALWDTKSIWLDVFESNKRGIYIYKKLGYNKTDERYSGGKRLVIMEKYLTEGNSNKR